MSFSHLHAHSHYSLLEGVAAPAALAARAAQFGMGALALTDHNGLYGAIPFYQACRAAGVQPILGLELDTETGDRLVLLARNRDGYRSLCRLASAVGQDRRPGQAGVGCPLDRLRAEHTGLIALSGGRRALLPRLVRAGQIPQASRLIGAYADLFGADNFYIELVQHDPSDAPGVRALRDLADLLGVPAVVANDALAAGPEETSQTALRDAIRTRTTLAVPHPDKAEHAAERYLKSPRQMEALFADAPEAFANARYLARRCDLELPLGGRRFPGITLPASETAFSQLYQRAFAGAVGRYRPLTPAVTARLQHELTVIGDLDFAPYFLIVADLVRWCHDQGIPCIARGSASASVVAYALGISQVDPLAYDLYFERFLNAERPEPPDIDLDLCWRRRDEVLNYVYATYGRDHVAMISTHVRFSLRSSWRDIARAHGLAPAARGALAARPGGYALAEAQAEAETDPAEADDPAGNEPDGDPAWGPLYPPAAETGHGSPDSPDVPALDPAVLADCAALEHTPRHLGIHCGGIVIAPFPLADEVPLLRATKGITITQYEMAAIAELGLIKIDLLGSRALSALSATVARVRQQGYPLDLDTIPFDDPATLALLGAGGTLGCFQLESPGMRALLKTMCPRSLDDVIAAISLFRPGPLEGALKDIFLARLRTARQPDYPHPAMAAILRETYGVVLFQEQFLRLVHELAGYSLGEAERLRRRLAKSPGPEERAALRAAFVAGAIGRDIAQPLAEQLWEPLAANAGFGFCKAHAASYGVVAYRTTYCKAHYPAELLAAVLDNQAGFYPAQVYVEEARRLGIVVRGPEVNSSAAGTQAQGQAIHLGLGAVQGLRQTAVAALLAARRAAGPFSGLADLLTRVPLRQAEITTLVQVGALDPIAAGHSRPELLWQARLWLPVLERERAGASTPGQGRLPLPADLPALPPSMPALRPYSPAEVLDLERAVLGFTRSANPLAPYAASLARFGAVPARELAAQPGPSVVVGGWPVVVRRHRTRHGGWMLFCTLQDLTDLCEVVVLPEHYAAAWAVLAGGGPILVRGDRETADHGGVILRGIKFRTLPLPA